MNGLADVIALPLPREVLHPRIPHPSLGECTSCGSRADLRPVHDDSAGGVLIAVRCDGCGWIVSMTEHARRRRSTVDALAEQFPELQLDTRRSPQGARGARPTLVVVDEAQQRGDRS